MATAANEFSSASLTRGATGGGDKSLGGQDGKRLPARRFMRPESRVMLSAALDFAARPGDSRGGGGVSLIAWRQQRGD